MTRIASVLIPMPVPEAFDYAEPEGMGLAPGDQVAVPLGPRLIRGVVSELREAMGGNRPLKPVAERLEEPPLPPGTMEFVQWAARYAVDAPGQPLAIALRGARAPKPRPDKIVVATGVQPKRMTPAREKVLAVVAEASMAPGQLALEAGVSSGVVKALVDEGVLDVELRETAPEFEEPDLTLKGKPLNDSQAAAADALVAMLGEGGFQAALL